MSDTPTSGRNAADSRVVIPRGAPWNHGSSSRCGRLGDSYSTLVHVHSEALPQLSGRGCSRNDRRGRPGHHDHTADPPASRPCAYLFWRYDLLSVGDQALSRQLTVPSARPRSGCIPSLAPACWLTHADPLTWRFPTDHEAVAPNVYTSARHDRFVRMSPGVRCRVRRLPYHDGGAKGFVTGRSSACVSRRMCCIRAGIARGAFGRDGPVQRQPVPR